MKERFVANLLHVAADLIADHPEAAAKLARRLGTLVHEEAERDEQRRQEERDRDRARGF